MTFALVLLLVIAVAAGLGLLGSLIAFVASFAGPRAVQMGATPVTDPADQRAAAVADAYVAGEFDYDELEWRILLALVPPPPDREARVRNWELAQKAMHERRPSAFPEGSGGSVVEFPTHSSSWSAVGPSTESIPWTAAPRRVEGPHCRFRELSSAFGHFDTFCDCGHDMEAHHEGGCTGCDAAWSQFPRPEMQEIGRPPEPVNPVKATRRESLQSHG